MPSCLPAQQARPCTRSTRSRRGAGYWAAGASLPARMLPRRWPRQSFPGNASFLSPAEVVGVQIPLQGSRCMDVGGSLALVGRLMGGDGAAGLARRGPAHDRVVVLQNLNRPVNDARADVAVLVRVVSSDQRAMVSGFTSASSVSTTSVRRSMAWATSWSSLASAATRDHGAGASPRRSGGRGAIGTSAASVTSSRPGAYARRLIIVPRACAYRRGGV
jgi:hypothetical protein